MIIYLHLLDCWITSDSSNFIYFWNLELENIQQKLTSEYFKDGIHSIIEIDYLSIVLIASK